MRPRRRPGPAIGLVEGLRGTVGVALLVVPRPVLVLLGEDPSSPGPRVFTAVLGARHLLQAGVTGLVPVIAPAEVGTGAVLRVGVVVDLVHAVTMLGWAILAPRHRRPALANAATALIFAGAGLLIARARGGPPNIRT